jgi:plasmid stabilization system protein ParE
MFRVEWIQSALNELAQIWNQGDSARRAAITTASHRIDQTLEQDPHHAGESRPGGRRVLFESPLGVLFRIEMDGQTVTVLRCWQFRRRTLP